MTALGDAVWWLERRFELAWADRGRVEVADDGLRWFRLAPGERSVLVPQQMIDLYPDGAVGASLARWPVPLGGSDLDGDEAAWWGA